MKRYNYKDDFEMIYLRHEYITKCESLDGKFVKEFAGVVNTTARIMYDKLYPNFNKVGFDRDDMIAITNVYMLGYMGLYSLRKNEDAKERFIQKFKEINGREPNEEEFYKKDRNNMINFLRQRLQHCSTICARKARNITVGRDRRGIFAETAISVEASDENIYKEYKKFGYRKVTKAEFKEAEKISKSKNSQDFFDKDGFKIFKIEMLNNGIKYDEYEMLFDSNNSDFLKTPEENLISYEDIAKLEGYRKEFSGLDMVIKRRKVNRFIEQNKTNKFLKKELGLARKWLKDPSLMV